jgi:hypothetical protein
MTPFTRDLILKVMDGDIRLGRLMWVFANHKRCDEMLIWCLKNNLKGKELFEWADSVWGFKFSLPVLQFISKKLDRDLEVKPILSHHLIHS